MNLNGEKSKNIAALTHSEEGQQDQEEFHIQKGKMKEKMKNKKISKKKKIKQKKKKKRKEKLTKTELISEKGKRKKKKKQVSRILQLSVTSLSSSLPFMKATFQRPLLDRFATGSFRLSVLFIPNSSLFLFSSFFFFSLSSFFFFFFFQKASLPTLNRQSCQAGKRMKEG